ncbi:MAG: hypothetical protein LC778_05160 [Acidobacteria bacterium]|nr:hypothetical protein [Acidobacteriota bacterium]
MAKENEWVKLKNAAFIKTEVVGVQVTGHRFKDTLFSVEVSLRGGAQIEMVGNDARKVWSMFGEQEEIKESENAESKTSNTPQIVIMPNESKWETT